MQSLINKEKIGMPSSDQATSSMNESGTRSKIDTPLTHPGSRVVPNSLLTARNQVGARTPIGRVLSNLNEQNLYRPSYVLPAWATHPTQTLGARMAWQADRLADLSSPSPKGHQGGET